MWSIVEVHAFYAHRLQVGLIKYQNNSTSLSLKRCFNFAVHIEYFMNMELRKESGVL